MTDTLCGMPYPDGGDESTIWREKRVKTRKAHNCYDCNVEIPIGEAAGCAESLYDGSWSSLYRCASCLMLAEMAATLAGVCAWWGGLDEAISELRSCGHDDLPTPREYRKTWELAGESEETHSETELEDRS